MRFDELFTSYSRAHGRYVMGSVNERGKVERAKGTGTFPGSPTPKDWEVHLGGKGVGLGLLPLLDDNTSVFWGAIDIDTYPFDHAALEKDAENLPLVITKSKSGGAHLWLFLNEPTPARLVFSKLSEWAAALGHGGVEIFPKQTSRVAENDMGNWINMPYYGDTRQCFYQGQDVPLEKFLEVAQSRRISKAILEKIKVIDDTDGAFFQDGPPCLQVVTSMGGAPEGTRNNFMFAVGVYLKLKYPDTWQQEILGFNRTHCRPPINETELSILVNSLKKKKYNYHCSKAPLVSHCNRALCVKRAFGVAQDGNDELNVNLSGLTKITTNPPRWLLNIDTVRVELESTNDLEQQRFKKFAIETVHKIPSKVSAKKWDELIQSLLDKVETIEAPPEASPQGQFLEHLIRFIEVNGNTETRDSLLRGQVYTEDGFAFFRSTDMFNYLRRERFTDLKTTGAMYTILNTLGMERGRFNCKGSTVSFWKIKIDKIQLIQESEFDAPTFDNPFGTAEP